MQMLANANAGIQLASNIYKWWFGQSLVEIKLFFVSKEYNRLVFLEVLKIFAVQLLFIVQALPTYTTHGTHEDSPGSHQDAIVKLHYVLGTCPQVWNVDILGLCKLMILLNSLTHRHWNISCPKFDDVIPVGYLEEADILFPHIVFNMLRKRLVTVKKLYWQMLYLFIFIDNFY